MNHNQTILDLSALPDHAKAQLIDFYEFLFKKYGVFPDEQNHDVRSKKFSKFLDSSVKVEKILRFSREKLHER